MGMNDKHNYDPTKWVDNSEPDIDAEHLNKIESALQEYGVSIDELAAAGGTAAKVKTTDTYGLVVSALGESTAQALIDAIANKVMNELINKNKIVNNLLATDASTVLAGTQGAALDKRLVAAEKTVAQLNSELSWKSFANGVSSVDISSLSWKAIHVFIIVNSNNHVTFSIPLVYPLVRASGNEFRFYNFGMYFNSGTYVGGRIGVSIQRIYIDSVLLNGQEVKESSHMWVSYR